MFSKKNRLITIIIISMILGIILGYSINKSLTNNSPKIEETTEGKNNAKNFNPCFFIQIILIPIKKNNLIFPRYPDGADL